MGKIVFEEEPTPAIPAAGNATLFVDSADEVLSLRLSSGTVVKYTALTDALVFKGVIDCSGNPNYPAADAGDTYKISVAGKIGGGAGASVEAGDMIICIVDGSPSGTQAAVGANWSIIQTNIDGAVIGPTSATNNAIAVYDGTTGKLLKDSVLTVSGSTITGSVTGNAGTVTTNANLTGAVTSVGNATSLGSFTSAQLAGALTDETGSGANVFAASPTLSGTPLSTTAAVDTNTTQIATTAFVLAQASATSPLADAAAAVVGTSTRYTREGHVHPYAVGYQVQSAAATYTTSANLTTTIPLDDTIPQNTEGTEILTVTITPKSATNNLIITFSGFGAIGTNNRTAISALFQDSTANALTAAASEAKGVDTIGPLGFVYTMAAGTTSATTFKVRVGPDAASTLRLNGTSGARRFGGVAEAVLTVREIQT